MPEAMPQLVLSSVSKVFRRANGDLLRAVDDVSLEVRKGEFLVLLGPSGCGKTTLLRSVAGLEQPDSGRISLGGIDLFDSARGVEVPTERRSIGMVFQSYALWPHMTVAANIGYPLKMRGVRRSEIEQRCTHILQKMHIADLGGQHPGQISGGQQQRVALARALVCGDDLILFDEPLSNVDAKVREHLRFEILKLQRDLGFTALYVTHDQEEAMGLATRIAVVADGRIAQLGTPQEVYLRPSGIQVARFVGSANEWAGRVVGARTDGRIETVFGRLSLPAASLANAAGDELIVMSRPESWTITLAPSSGACVWEGVIRTAAFLGAANEYLVDLPHAQILVRQHASALMPVGAKVWCEISPEAFVVLDNA